MTDGNKVTVIIPVVCDCGHPIEGADVKVDVFNTQFNESKPERTISGRTDGNGIFLQSYTRESGNLSAVKGGRVEVIACDKTSSAQELKVDAQVSPEGVVNLISTVYDTVIGDTIDASDIKGLLDKAESLGGGTSEQLFEFILIPAEVIEVTCHEDTDCDDAPDEHATGTLLVDGGAVRVAFSDEIDGNGIFGSATRDFTYDLTNLGEDTVTDFKLCFPTPQGSTVPEQVEARRNALVANLDAVLDRELTLPPKWKARRDGLCLVFETDKLSDGILKDGKGAIKIKADDEVSLGRVTASASTLKDGEHVDLTDDDATLIPGPLLFSVAPEDELTLTDRFVQFDQSAIADRGLRESDVLQAPLVETLPEGGSALERTVRDPSVVEPGLADTRLVDRSQLLDESLTARPAIQPTVDQRQLRIDPSRIQRRSTEDE